MNNTAKRRITNAVEIFKTVLMALLVVSLILLVVIYISGMRVYENMVMKKSLGESFDKLWSVQSGTEPEGLDGAYLMPEFVGYKQSTFLSPRGCVGDSDSVSELYDLIKPCILELFGSDAVCRELPVDYGADTFFAARENEEFIYLRYHQPVLYQLIYAYAADTLTVSEADVASGSEGNIGAYVSELIIIPDKDFAAHRFVAYASDGDGRYYEFRPAQHIVTSSFYISKLADGGGNINTYEFEFADDGHAVLIDGEIECSVISSQAAVVEEESTLNGLLRLFGYNPDKLDGYSDEGADVYIDSHSQLRIGEGSILFSTSDASETSGGTLRGLGIDTLLGYTGDGTPSLFDKLTAVDNLIGKLDAVSADFAGGGATACLGDVYSDGALLVVEYFLTYNNIRIGSEPYLRAVLTDNTVCELELRPITVSSTEESTLTPQPDYILRKLTELGRLSADTHIASVSLNYTGSEAEWTVELEN
ncbi:MAG: hypothetical protein IJ428_06780 [Clostridia bacterium]|nr:hypothetical protein [Clostridia bacterium]